MPVTIPASRVESFAGVTEAMVTRARTHGVIAEPFTVSDALAVKVYTALSSLPWPGEKRPQNQKLVPEMRNTTAAWQAKDLMSEDGLGPEAVMWVTASGAVTIARTIAERIEVEMGTRGTLAGFTPRIAIGEWIAEIRAAAAEYAAQRRRPSTHANVALRPQSRRTAVLTVPVDGHSQPPATAPTGPVHQDPVLDAAPTDSAAATAAGAAHRTRPGGIAD